MIHITDPKYEFDNSLQVLKFGALWCSPCKTMIPVLEKLSIDISVSSIDVDEVPELAKKFKIRMLPTIIFLKDGKEAERIVGVTSLSNLKDLVKKYDVVE